MAYTADELETRIALLEEALLNNELEVQYADRRVRYRSTSDIKSALDYFKSLLSDTLAAESGQTRKHYRAYATKGL